MSLLRQILFGVALIGALVAYVLITGHRIANAEARATTAESGERAARDDLTNRKVSERIVTQYVDRVQFVHERGATLIQKVPVYVTAQADAACTLSRGFVRLHDAAATSATLPDRRGAADAQPSGVALSAASGVIVGNYTTCHATTEQLTALQSWVRANGGAGP
jgi:hypothetical protein